MAHDKQMNTDCAMPGHLRGVHGVQTKLAGLNFVGENNACQSLRMLAEWVRRGDIRLVNSVALGERSLQIIVDEPAAKRHRVKP